MYWRALIAVLCLLIGTANQAWTEDERRLLYVAVQSEKLLEIDFRGRGLIRAGDQFGIGRIR